MRADFSKNGILVLFPQCQIERYALKKWQEDNKDVKIIVDEKTWNTDKDYEN